MTALILSFALLASLPASEAGKGQTLDSRAVEAAIAGWDGDEAARLAARMVAQSPDSPEARMLLARAHFMQGRYADALAELTRLETQSIDTDSKQHAREFRAFVEPLAELDTRFTALASPHFSIHFVDGPDRILARRGLEVLEASYAVMSSEFGISPANRIRVEIFPDAETFQKASTLTRKEIETSGTIALCKFNRIMMMSPRLVLRGFSWCDTLCHEYTHYVLWKRNGSTIPIWLHEGIARYQEVRWTGAPGSDLTARMKQVLKGAVDANRFVTFDEMHPSFAKLTDPHQVELASAEVLSVVRTVLARGGSPLMGKALDALRDGHAWRQMFEVALDQPFETFWESWKKDVSTELADVKGAPVPDKLVELRDPMSPSSSPPPKPDGATAEPDEESRGNGRWVRLGDLLYLRQMYAAAAVEYEKAVASEDPSHVLLNRLAQTYSFSGDAARAVDRYRSSLALQPEYAPTLTSLGLLYQRLGDAASAVEVLEQAAAINPYDPRIHEALADTYGGLGRDADRRNSVADLQILRPTPAPTKEPQ